MIITKTPREIEAIREAGRLVARTLDLLCAAAGPGVTTAELDLLAEAFIRKNGGIPTCKGYMGYPASICASVNEEVVHGIPGDRPLREGDIVGLDIVITLNGLIADATRTAAIGKIAPRLAKLLDVTQQALNRAIAQSVPGAKLGTVSGAIESTALAAGYSVVREYCGHGVGRKMHEDPQVPNYGVAGRGPVIRPGWTYAIEPMINMGCGDTRVLPNGWTVVTADGMPSAHFEHTVAILESGPAIMTLP